MAITIPMIFDKLSNPVLENGKLFIARKTDIQGAALLDSPFSTYNEKILYVLQDPITLKDLNDVLPNHLLYFLNGYVYYTGKYLENQSILVLKNTLKPKELLSEIQNIIFDYREIFEHFLSLIRDDAGLQILTNLISSYLMNPVAVFARGLKLLAHSQNYTISEKYWLDTEKTGYLEMESNMSYILKEQAKQCEQNKSSFIFFVEGMQYRVATKLIIKGNQEIGTFQVVECNQIITQGALDMIEAIATYLAIELNKNGLVNFNHGIMDAQLLIDLLEKKIDNLQLLKNRNISLGLFDKFLFVLTIKPIAPRFLVDEQLSKIRDQLNLILPFSNCLIYDKGIVVIISKYTNCPFDSEKETLLLALLKEWNLCCGLSESSNHILETSKLYKQSIQAIRLGFLVDPGCLIYHYSKYTLYDFFDYCLQSENIRSYHHPSIAILKDYDTKHQSALLRTLRNFVNNHNSQMATVKQMYISRNTLLYRINKIKKLTNIDLDNPDTVFHLQLTLKLMEVENIVNEQLKNPTT